MTVGRAAKILGMAPSTLHRWINEGVIAGEQLTPGAPWRIRVAEDLRSRFVETVPEGYVSMLKATHLLGVSRQTVLQRVKRGELNAVHVRLGRRKGLRIQMPDPLPGLFDRQSAEGVHWSMSLQKATDVGVKHPFHRLRHQRGIQRAEGLMRASTRPKPV